MGITGMIFECIRDGLKIKGMQYVPADFDESKKYPAIIFSHGFTDSYLGMEQFCKDFAKMGYVTFCFNFCGGGRTDEKLELEREGKSTDMSVMTEVEDLTAVMEYARGLSFVDNDNLILAGGSQGGFVSGLTAAKHGDKVSKLVMIFPALCIPDHARRGWLGGSNYNPLEVPEIIDCNVTTLGKKFHDEMAGYDAFLGLSPYKGPVLILQGTDDNIVNYSYAIRAKENYQKGQCHLQLIRNMGHGMDEGQYQGVVASMRQFLNEKEEILSIRIIITNIENKTEGEVRKCNFYFTGYCETEYFQGTVLPGGCDKQEFVNDVQKKVRAEYTLDGLDIDGKHCQIHIVNQRGETDFEPVIETDSEALSWLNSAKLTAVIEGGNGGPNIRIYMEKKN